VHDRRHHQRTAKNQKKNPRGAEAIELKCISGKKVHDGIPMMMKNGTPKVIRWQGNALMTWNTKPDPRRC